MAIQASKTCKVWIFLNLSMCYSGCFWDTGRWFTNFSEFFWIEISQWFYCNFCCLLHDPSLLFIVLFLGSRGTIDSLFCPLGTRARFVPITQKVEFSLFLIFFFLLVLFSQKPMADYLFQSALVSDVTFFMVQLLVVLPLYLFSQMSEIPLCRFESPLLLLPFL